MATAKLRKFVFEGRPLADLDPSKSPQEIKDLHAAQIPALTTATFKFDPVKNEYEFVKSAGTKG